MLTLKFVHTGEDHMVRIDIVGKNGLVQTVQDDQLMLLWSVRRLGNQGIPVAEISSLLGISESQVSKYCRGRTFGEIPDASLDDHSPGEYLNQRLRDHRKNYLIRGVITKRESWFKVNPEWRVYHVLKSELERVLEDAALYAMENDSHLWEPIPGMQHTYLHRLAEEVLEIEFIEV